MVDQFATIKSAKPKLLHVLVNTHDPCQNAIVRSQKESTFLLIWLIRKGFLPASNTVYITFTEIQSFIYGLIPC